jgi:hypothetical protein
MLQAKLFIVCNQAFMQTDARVEGSYPFRRTYARGGVSGTCEFHQWRYIMIVCCAQGCDVSSAQLANVAQTAAAPTETLATKTFDQKVGRQASVTAISVRKRVDRDQAMVE